jgi:hypothetical protein
MSAADNSYTRMQAEKADDVRMAYPSRNAGTAHYIKEKSRELEYKIPLKKRQREWDEEMAEAEKMKQKLLESHAAKRRTKSGKKTTEAKTEDAESTYKNLVKAYGGIKKLRRTQENIRKGVQLPEIEARVYKRIKEARREYKKSRAEKEAKESKQKAVKSEFIDDSEASSKNEADEVSTSE